MTPPKMLQHTAQLALVSDSHWNAEGFPLETERATLQCVFDALPIAVVVLDAGGRVIYKNQACAHAEHAPAFVQELQTGWDYVEACRTLHGTHGGELLAGVQDMLSGRRITFGMELLADPAGAGGRFQVEIRPLPLRKGWTVTHNRLMERREQWLGEWETLVNSLPAAIYMCDTLGHVTFYNQAAAELWGRHPRLGNDLWCGSWKIFQPNGTPLELEEYPMAIAIREGEPVSGQEIVIERPDGKRVNVIPQAQPLRDTQGNITGAINVLFDISSYQKVELDHALIRRQLEGIIESTMDGIISKSLDGRVTSWNHAAEQLFCYSAEEMIGEPISIIVPEDLKQEEAQLLEELRRGAHVHHFETVRKRKDGRLINVSLTISPIRDAAGTISGAAIIARDITERKHAEKQAREQARLLDLASDAILVVDFKSGEIVYWNEGAERLHGWTAGEVLGSQVSDLLLADANDAIRIGDGLMEKGEWSGELRKRTKSGKEVIASSRVTLVRDENDHPISLLAMHTDITERKTLEAQFLRAQRLDSVGTLASGVAHDLNNILSPIIMSVPVLEEELEPELKMKILSTILSAANRGAEIVKQVLMFARGVETRRVPVNCRRLVEEVTGMAQETFSKSITVMRNCQEDLWPVEGDPTQLHQVILNLTINARDAMPHGGVLSLSVNNVVVDESYASMVADAKPGPCVVVQVSDNGVGIPKDILDKIFDPFFTTKAVGKGTGLGLSTVLGIVKNHHGFLTVDSGMNRGTTFRIFLPASAVNSERNGEEGRTQVPRGSGELLMLVDDEEAVRVVAGAMLEQAGYKVLLASDGTEAIAFYAQRGAEIRLVITDASMPFLDGASLTRALQKMEPGVKVIGTSGHSAESDARELQQLKLTAFLTKPYNKSLLLTTIHQALHG